jgi:aminopeptidase
MVTKDEIEKLAQVAVRCTNVKEGDMIYVRAGIHNYEIAESIAFHARMKGGVPFVSLGSDNYVKRVFDEVPANYLETMPKHQLALAKSSDVYIVIEPSDNPGILKGTLSEKIAANQKAGEPIRKEILDNKRWLYQGYPTKRAAEHYGIPFDDLESLVVGGSLIDYDDLEARCKRLDKLLANADSAHIWDDQGTDLTLNIKGRPVKLDDGFISDTDIASNDKGANIPAGEVFIAPHETVGEGTLFCPLTRERYTSNLIEDLLLKFKDGRLVLEECQARTGEKDFFESIKRSQTVDAERYKPVRTTHVGELGIGLNPKITKPIGYILTDEKIGGSVHVAIGANTGSYGGKNESVLHWDFVTGTKENLEVTYTDGSKRQLLEKGKLL